MRSGPVPRASLHGRTTGTWEKPTPAQDPQVRTTTALLMLMVINPDLGPQDREASAH